MEFSIIIFYFFLNPSLKGRVKKIKKIEIIITFGTSPKMLTKPHKMMAAPSKMRYPHRLMYIDIYKNAVLYSKKFQSSNAKCYEYFGHLLPLLVVEHDVTDVGRPRAPEFESQ